MNQIGDIAFQPDVRASTNDLVFFYPAWTGHNASFFTTIFVFQVLCAVF